MGYRILKLNENALEWRLATYINESSELESTHCAMLHGSKAHQLLIFVSFVGSIHK